jgi:hypothetical protein
MDPNVERLNAMARALKRQQDEAAGILKNFDAVGTQAYLDAMSRALSTSLPKMDDVIAASTATGSDLRGLASDFRTTPLKSGTEYGLERVERAVTQLAEIAAGMADNTRANAEIAKTGLEQSIALVAGQRDLHVTTQKGMEASDMAAGAIVKLTAALVVLTLVLIFLTTVLVLREI